MRKKNDNIVIISGDVRENERRVRERFSDCGDVQIRRMRLGEERKVDCLMVYIEVTTSNMMLEDSALGRMIGHFWEVSPEGIQEFVEYNSLGIADVKKLTDMEQVFAGVLAGDAVFFLDGFDQAMKISSVGYPSMGVTEVEMEKVLRGSKEGFSDSVKTNSALIRKRLRDTRLKVVEFYIGERSHTLVQMVYMEDLVREEFLEQVKERLGEFKIDGILDSGMLEQLTEDCKAYIAQNQLTKAPNYFKLWMSGEKDDEVVAINDKLEALVEEMSNTKSASLIGLLNNYPMIPVSAHVRPFHIYWLNLAAGVIFPIGLFFYFRIWAFRIRLAKDMERIIKNNEQVQFIIQKSNK